MATNIREPRFGGQAPPRRTRTPVSPLPDLATVTAAPAAEPVAASLSPGGARSCSRRSLGTRATRDSSSSSRSTPHALSASIPAPDPITPAAGSSSRIRTTADTLFRAPAFSISGFPPVSTSLPLIFSYFRNTSFFVTRHLFSCQYSFLLLTACVLPLLSFHPCFSQPWCKFDWALTPEQTVARNCGFICPDPWDKDDPHECGAPHSCCCAPKCDLKEARKHAFVGINWSDKYSRLLQSREKQLAVLKKNGFYHIKIFTPESLSSIWQVYGSEGNAYVGLPNVMLTRLVTDETFAQRIVERQLKPYSSIIRTVVVGNEPLLCIRTAQWASKQECGSLNIPAKLLPAMKAVKKALVQFGLGHIPVTTALNGGVLEMSRNPWTPCVADYRDAVKPILKELWAFLSKQKPPAPFIVNIYSWFAAMNGHIKPDIAVGHPAEHIPSDGKYNYYFNFDMQVEMQRVAMCKNNITHLDLWIGETGWPTGGSPRATLKNAHLYATHAVMRSRGMTLHNATIDNIRTVGMAYPVFLFEAFDEAAKFEIEHGNKFENTFGIFYENGQPKWSNPDGLINLPLERRRGTRKK